MVRTAHRDTVRWRTAAAAAAALAACLCSAAPPPAEPPAGKADHTPRKIGPGLYALGKVTIDARKRTIRCPGRVNMRQGGPIELLACLETGKVHESVLVLDCKPLHVQLALLLLDLKPGRNPAVDYPKETPEAAKDPGDLVNIFVEWSGPGEKDEPPRKVRRRAGELLRYVDTSKAAGPQKWAFIGSLWAGKRFGADIDGSVIVTFHDSLAILELAATEVNDDIHFNANEKALPKVGTKVELIVQARAKPKDTKTEAGEKE